MSERHNMKNTFFNRVSYLPQEKVTQPNFTRCPYEHIEWGTLSAVHTAVE